MALANTRSSMDAISPMVTAAAAAASPKTANEMNYLENENSWYEITVQEENEAKEEAARLEAAAKCKETIQMSSQHSEAGNKSSSKKDFAMSSLYNVSAGRQIEIDILDSANVKKYEKLVKSDQIKSPFKRRLSGDSSSDELGDVKSNTSGMDCDRGDGTNQHLNCKRTKMHDNDEGVDERLRRESCSSGASSQNSRKQAEYETDEAVLARRQKQIDYGKNTLGYENYIRQVPRHTRTKDQPRTPQKHLKCSRRGWDGLIRVWRKKLHCYDPTTNLEDDA